MSAPRVLVLTGAGISADSGVATFRGGGGLWEGQRVEDVATPEAWSRDPATVWRFYQARRAQLGEVEPNPAHHALVRLGLALKEAGGGLTLVSQNVDDLHQRAGSTVLETHGQLRRLRCEACGERTWDEDRTDGEIFLACGSCGFPRLRPDVVWFGEVPYELEAIETALRAADHFVTVGTSGVVYPAAGYLEWARSAGLTTWVQSLEEPENVHPRDRFLPGRAAEVLPEQVEAWIRGWC